MKPRLTAIAQRLALLIALAVSSMLRLDYVSGEPQFCAVGSGCERVRASEYSSFLGLSWPLIGMIALSVLIVAVLYAERPRDLKRVAVVHTLGALCALGLIGLQLFVIGASCSLCMVVDGAILFAAALAWVRYRAAVTNDQAEKEATPLRVLWGATAIAVALAPAFWQKPEAKTVSVPSEVAAWQVEGRVNLIVFTDFQCPFCRRLHPLIEELAHGNRARLAVTRIMTPLPNHPGADPAARAYLCAPKPMRDRLADKLYTADAKKLNTADIQKMASALEIEEEPFRSCLKSAATTAELARHKKLAGAAKISGLPATFVEDYFVPGADGERLRDAVGRALAGKESGGDFPWLLILIASFLGASSMASLVAGKPRA